MKRMGLVAAVLGLTLLGDSKPVRAQGVYVMPATGYVTPLPVGNPFLRPSGIFNYGAVIQGQQQLAATLQQFQQQLVAGQAAQATAVPPGGMPVTGHPSTFYNTSHYFYYLGGGAGLAAYAPGFPSASGVGFFPTRPATGILAARNIR